MVEGKKILLKKTILLLMAFSLIVIIYQITLAQNISFSNDIIDHYFHFSEFSMLVFLGLLMIIYLVLISSRAWQKILLGITIIPVVLILLISIFFLSGAVFAPSQANARYYFYKKDGYNYYIVSERYVAFEGSANIKIYKEKPLFLFIKERKVVNDDELLKNKVDINKAINNFLRISFKEEYRITTEVTIKYINWSVTRSSAIPVSAFWADQDEPQISNIHIIKINDSEILKSFNNIADYVAELKESNGLMDTRISCLIRYENCSNDTLSFGLNNNLKFNSKDLVLDKRVLKLISPFLPEDQLGLFNYKFENNSNRQN